MGFLQAAGQSGAIGQLGQSFLSGAVQVGQLQQQSEENEMKKQLMQSKIQEQERNNEWLDVTETLAKAKEKGYGGVVDLGIKQQIGLGLHKEVPAADGTKKTFMRRRDISEGVKSLEQQGKAHPAVLADREEWLTVQMDKLEPKTTTDPKIKAQYDQFNSERRMVRKKLYGLDEEGIKSIDPTHDVYQGSTLIKAGTPKEPEVAETLAYTGPDGGEYQVNRLKDGTYVHAETNAPYEGDYNVLYKIGAAKEPTSPAAIYMAASAVYGDPNSTKEDKAAAKQRMDAAFKIQSAGASVMSATRERISTRPTNTPGVFFDPVKRKYLMDTPGGEIALTSEQAKQMNLSYIEDKPVTNIKAMQQNAPSVLFLSGEARKVVEAEIKNLGPVSSRWREFWAGKIGAPDPSFTKLKANLNLLQTKLSQMHVGAQGGIEMVKHFKEMVESGKQSPENMLAALETIDQYANEVKQKKFSDGETGGGEVNVERGPDGRLIIRR